MDNIMLSEIIKKLEINNFTNNTIHTIKQILEDVTENYEIAPKKERIEGGNNFLIEQFLLTKKVEGCSHKTRKYYKLLLNIFDREQKLDFRNCHAEDIRNFLNLYQTKRGACNQTVDNVRRVLSSFFRWLEEEDYILKNPMKKIHKIKTSTLIKEIFSDEDIERLRIVADKNIREKAMLELLLSSGMRVGELVNLNRKSLNLNELSCIVKGKGNKEREVYFNVKTKVLLEEYLKIRSDTNKALFVGKYVKKRLTINAIETIFKRLGKLANIENVHPHKFRRTMATKALEKGMPIEQVQRLLGHSKIDTTLHYAVINQNTVKYSHRKYIA